MEAVKRVSIFIARDWERTGLAISKEGDGLYIAYS
jgi:hypothetical protein